MNTSGSDVYKLLEWDSSFFGFPVALILKEILTANELHSAISLLKKQGVKCVYWPASFENPEVISLAEKHQGKLVDIKVIYARSLEGFSFNYAEKLYIRPYESSVPDEELIKLAVSSGLYSRFKTDDRFGKENFEKLYTRWITDSVNKKIAKEVFVSRFQGDLTGLITVAEKNGSGSIGLVAINEKYRGLGIGNMLMEYALLWFKKNQYNKVEVATQESNKAASALYEKFGFKPEKKFRYFHFWL